MSVAKASGSGRLGSRWHPDGPARSMTSTALLHGSQLTFDRKPCRLSFVEESQRLKGKHLSSICARAGGLTCVESTKEHSVSRSRGREEHGYLSRCWRNLHIRSY